VFSLILRPCTFRYATLCDQNPLLPITQIDFMQYPKHAYWDCIYGALRRPTATSIVIIVIYFYYKNVLLLLLNDMKNAIHLLRVCKIDCSTIRRNTQATIVCRQQRCAGRMRSDTIMI